MAGATGGRGADQRNHVGRAPPRGREFVGAAVVACALVWLGACGRTEPVPVGDLCRAGGGAFGDRRQDLRFQLLRRCLGVEDRQGAHRLARLAHDVVEGSPDVRVADAQAVFDARAFGIGDRVEGVEMGEIEEVVIVGMLG
nr:hypothetical protein [Nocardia cyriacigeorgica]